jgi:hypothetical protein
MVIAKADAAGTGVTSAWQWGNEHDHVQCSQHPDRDREGDQGEASASRREIPAVGDPSESVEGSEQSEAASRANCMTWILPLPTSAEDPLACPPNNAATVREPLPFRPESRRRTPGVG